MVPAAVGDLVLQDLARGYPEMSLQELSTIVAQWDLTPYVARGVLGGVGMSRGSEFHFLATPEFRLDRKAMRAGLAPLFDRYGFLTTRVAHGDLANQRFNHLFGFELTWADEQFQYFILTKLPFGERATCQQ